MCLEIGMGMLFCFQNLTNLGLTKDGTVPQYLGTSVGTSTSLAYLEAQEVKFELGPLDPAAPARRQAGMGPA